MAVQEHHGNDKSCVWHAADFSDGELKEETFCIRFASVESELILPFISNVKFSFLYANLDIDSIWFYMLRNLQSRWMYYKTVVWFCF